ncbi:MAG: hypothetical protein KF833_12180 [Verrucomicrobiae bacterium]|nr:hypothetical protein [Verrucomicrobiae bacterium]
MNLPPETPPDPLATVLRRIFLAQALLVAGVVALVIIGNRFPGHLGSVPGSLLLGALGGSLSLLRRLKGGSDDVVARFATHLTAVIMPLVYGALMAGVAYLLFMSGILTGEGGQGLFTSNLFPLFTSPEIPDGTLLSMQQVLQIRPATVQDLGKLLVWCFLAGYSESFIVGILEVLERRQQSPAPPRTP